MEIKDVVDAVASQIETKSVEFDSKVNAVKSDVETKLQEKSVEIENLKGQITKITERADELDTLISKKANDKVQAKSFGEALADAADNEMGNIEKALKSQGGSHTIQLKAVGNMLLSSSLTGDSVASYSQRQAILPAQALNFRDLVPSVSSATGTYVQYRETGSEGSIAAQTEGSSKSQIDYDLTEVKTVNAYIAGYATYSKQFAKSLPFMQGTLSRMLLRDFFKAENASFFSTVSGAATGVTTVTATNDVEEIVQLIANTKNANYNASFALVSPSQMARLIIATFAKGYYAGAGAIILNGAGGVTIWGTPVLEASWVTDDKVLIIDRDFIERVEVEGLNVTFSYENGTNFVQNLVTARVECYEAINLMMPSSAIFADLGNVV
jgi:HK97 family phage major capsid protein